MRERVRVGSEGIFEGRCLGADVKERVRVGSEEVFGAELWGVSGGQFQPGAAAGLRRRSQELGAGAVPRDALRSSGVLGARGRARLRGCAGHGADAMLLTDFVSAVPEELEVPREGKCLTLPGCASRLSGRA